MKCIFGIKISENEISFNIDGPDHELFRFYFGKFKQDKCSVNSVWMTDCSNICMFVLYGDSPFRIYIE